MPSVDPAALTIAEAAAMYGVTPGVITRAIHATEPPFLRAKKPGRSYVIHVDDLKAWWDQVPTA